jgi:hypothetical protein
MQSNTIKRTPISTTPNRDMVANRVDQNDGRESHNQKDRCINLNHLLTNDDGLMRLVKLLAKQAAREYLAV